MSLPFKARAVASLLVIALLSTTMSQTPPPKSAPTTNVTVVYAGRLIDAVSAQARTNVSIVIENGRIREVQDGKVSVTGAQVYDLGDSTVLPGLIDCHTHLTFQLKKGKTLKDLLIARESTLAIPATKYARRTLLAGFTTVRDVGSVGFVDVSLRDAIRDGEVVGPRMFVAARMLSITGGHGDFSSGMPREGLLTEPGYRDGIINSPEDGVRAVRYMLKYGADHIKVVSTGGVLSLGDSQAGEQLTEAELRAVVETAHTLGFKVAAHAHGAGGIRNALRAGVDSVEHGTYLDEEIIALFKQRVAGRDREAYLVPTISAGKWTQERAGKGDYPEAIARKAAGLGTLIQEAFARAYRGGVKIAFGTDAGVYPHGLNAREFHYMVEAGMPPMEAILCATKHAADLLGQSANIGSVQPGRYADLVAVDGDPLADIKLLQKVSFVMKEGRVYKLDGQPVERDQAEEP